MNTTALQTALRARGFDPGPIDGVFGPKTRTAVRAFQMSIGLPGSGLVGPKTMAALFGEAASTPVKTEVPLQLTWMLEASRLRGVKETPGAADNPVILDWAEDLKVAYNDDGIPWCGLFTAHCMNFGLPDEPLPANILGARQWSKFGRAVTPQWGSVLVFWRGSRDGWQGHVGFYWAEDATHFHVLGGNQSDMVSVTRIARDRLLDARWPLSVEPLNIIRRSSANGILESKNEQ